MGESCTISPRVRTASGEYVNSKLFSDLKKSVGYKNARKVYLKVREGSFIDAYGDVLDKDENGEFLLDSLKTVDSLSPMLGIRIRKGQAAKESGAYEPMIATHDNVTASENTAITYNSKPGNEFIALPEFYEDDEGVNTVNVKLVENTPEAREEASKLTRQQILLSRIKEIAGSFGINENLIDAFVDILREDTGNTYDSVVSIARDFYALSTIAKGLGGEIVHLSEMSELVFDVLSESPLVQRLVSAVSTEEKLAAIFTDEELSALGDKSSLDSSDIAVAAVRRLIGEYILSGSMADLASDDTLRDLVPLFSRVADIFDQLFSQLDSSALASYINQATTSPVTRDVLKTQDKDYEEVEYEQQSDTEQHQEVSERVKQQKKLIHDLIDTSVRRYKILSARDKDYDKSFDKDMTNQLYVRYTEQEYELGVYDFIEETLGQLSDVETRLIQLQNDNQMSTERKATLLKNIKDFIQSYSVSLDAIQKAVYNGVIKPNAEMTDIINQATFMVGKLLNGYEQQKNPLLISFVKEFVGTGLVVPFGKEKGKVYTAEDLLKMAEKDISVFDRWLDSMAESGDMMLRILDQKSKQARSAARLNTIEFKKKLDAAYLRLKRSGIIDTSFMFERDPNGKKTGKYISKEEAERLDPARRKYYEEVMAIKRELDALLPNGATSLRNIVRVRKDFVERIKNSNSIQDVIRETKEALKDKVKRRSDNVETGGDENVKAREEKSVLMDFSGNQVETIPLQFINSKDGESIEDLSEDVTSAMLMYANMACNYSAMNNIVGLLELAREKISERPVQQRAGAKAMVNVLKAFGIPVETPLTKSGEATKIVQRMNDWFHSQVYSRYMADEGEVFGLDVGMLANMSNEVTALNQFALNILSGISNVMTASAMNRIESICGQYFTVKSLAKADKIFWAEMGDFLKDVGNPVKTSKLALFMEKFNTMQDFESTVREQEYGKSRFSRLMTTNSLYVINNAGELWIQNRAALALSESYGLKDKDGNDISLWDSQEVVIDKDGVARLVTKPGIKKSDGTLWEDSKDIIKFTNKSKSLNQRMNGIYNYEDRNAAQAYAIGRMGLMFRKWIKPSLNRRYASLNYNFDVDEWEEGFYNTAGRFFMQLMKDLKRGQFDVVTTYKNLDPREKANLMRFAVEVGQFVSVCAAFAILKDIKKSKDDDGDEALAKSWWFNQLLYQTRRLESEIGSQMIINPQMIQEAFNILKSPAACVSSWEGTLNMTKLMMPSSWTTTLQTGRYKGHTKAYKLFWDSPLIPMHRTIYRGLHPQNSLQFYDL